MPMSFEPGAPAESSEFIPLCVPEIQGNEWKYVKECLDTNWVSSVGAYVNRFEQNMADYVGAQHAVATVNGTAALHIALMVAGIQANEEVLVSDLTFIAPVNAIKYIGACPVFIDVEPQYWQMNPELVEAFIENECYWHNGALWNKSSKRRVRAIMPVHILGHPVDMDPIRALARKYDLVIIEDATESLGAKYRGEIVGTLGDIGCFSFNGNKLITTGSGGMIVTNNEAWAQRAKYLTTQAKDDPLEYEHGEVGYNYRLTNIQAAMGCAQLELIEAYIQAKKEIAKRYTQAFKNMSGIEPMREARWAYSVYWLYTALIDEDVYGMSSRELLQQLQGVGIQTRPLWQPMHLSPVNKNCQTYFGDVAARLNSQSLSLPCSVGLKVFQQQLVIKQLLKMFER